MGETGICLSLCAVLFVAGFASSGYVRNELSQSFESENPGQAVISFLVNDASPSEPVGEKNEKGNLSIRSASGGIVSEVKGESGKIFIYIANGDGSTSVYGNLEKSAVIDRQSVQNGQVIGEYNEKNSRDFYYSVTHN